MPGDPLARDPRVLLAEERTLLAWVRTGLALMGFGFVVARFGVLMRELAAQSGVTVAAATPVSAIGHPSLWIGAALVVLGVVVNLVAAAQHARRVKRLVAGEIVMPGAGFGVTVSLVLAAVGAGMAAYLFHLPSP